MTKSEKMPFGNTGQGSTEAQRPSGVPSSADEMSRMRKPDPDELPDRALEEVSGGARISKSDLLKLQ